MAKLLARLLTLSKIENADQSQKSIFDQSELNMTLNTNKHLKSTILTSVEFNKLGCNGCLNNQTTHEKLLISI